MTPIEPSYCTQCHKVKLTGRYKDIGACYECTKNAESIVTKADAAKKRPPTKDAPAKNAEKKAAEEAKKKAAEKKDAEKKEAKMVKVCMMNKWTKCTNPKVPGQGEQYCKYHKDMTLDERKAAKAANAK
tara:strand:- start:106 stop:492 length:387 start_codon:yes stop_codon:yes gene_type:complete